MKEKDVILKRQKHTIRFKNGDMDFALNWAIGVSQIVGLSPAQILYAAQDIKDGDPVSWRAAFRALALGQMEQGRAFVQNNQRVAAGQSYLGAAYALRGELQYAHSASAEFKQTVGEMEQAFQRGVGLMDVPIRSVEIRFEHTSLPGYFLQHDEMPRPILVMIGGGDTFREDLFYFAGYPAWKRGYNALMIDLPGQGMTPERGLHFQVAMEKPIGAALDWLEQNAAGGMEQLAMYGVSGGGYFTAQAVAADSRIKAWVASTPIFDVAELFRREFGGALKAPGVALNALMRIAGALNESAGINLEKYAWQFGTSDFKSAVDAVLAQARVVDYSRITTPSLFLMGEGEAQELKRQTLVLRDDFLQRGVDVTLREFTAAEGAEAHCQLDNLRLAHLVIFDWLDRVFEHSKPFMP